MTRIKYNDKYHRIERERIKTLRHKKQVRQATAITTDAANRINQTATPPQAEDKKEEDQTQQAYHRIHIKL